MQLGGRGHIACGRIACKADNVCNIPLGEYNLNFKKCRKVLKFCLPSAVLYSCKFIQQYHFQADLIWCDSTFNQPIIWDWILLSCAWIFIHIFALILSIAHIMELTFSTLFRITYGIGGEGAFHLIAVLRIRDVYPGSRILIFTHPGSRISDPGSRIQKQVEKKGVKKKFLSNIFL